jgi:phosphonate transport system substrate-binding protein
MRLSATLASAALLVAATAASADTFKLAITDVEGLERLQTEWGPFKAALEGASGHTFEFYPVNSRTAAVEALKAKRVDFVVTGPAEYVVINKMTEAKSLIGLSRPDYFCGLIVMADSPYLKPADLKGTKVAMDDIGSTSGHLCPSQLLADYGVNPVSDIGEIVHTSRNIAHEALKRGDVAALGANYNSWINNTRAKDESTPPGAFRVIARSGDLPNDVLMVAAHVDPALAQSIRDAAIARKSAVIEAILAGGDENAKFRGMDLVAVDDKAYDPVRAMYVTIGQPQFSNFIGE